MEWPATVGVGALAGASLLVACGGSSSSTMTLANSAPTSVISNHNGRASLAAIGARQSFINARHSGLSFTLSDETIAGQRATCTHSSHSGDPVTYCLTTCGALAKVRPLIGSFSKKRFPLTSDTPSSSASPSRPAPRPLPGLAARSLR